MKDKFICAILKTIKQCLLFGHRRRCVLEREGFTSHSVRSCLACQFFILEVKSKNRNNNRIDNMISYKYR